jgi:dihydroflavonol-4-reductase
VRSKTNDAKI